MNTQPENQLVHCGVQMNLTGTNYREGVHRYECGTCGHVEHVYPEKDISATSRTMKPTHTSPKPPKVNHQHFTVVDAPTPTQGSEDELDSLLKQVRTDEYGDSGNYNEAKLKAAIQAYNDKARVDELELARDMIPRFMPMPTEQLRGKTAYNEYIKKRLTELKLSHKEDV